MGAFIFYFVSEEMKIYYKTDGSRGKNTQWGTFLILALFIIGQEENIKMKAGRKHFSLKSQHLASGSYVHYNSMGVHKQACHLF